MKKYALTHKSNGTIIKVSLFAERLENGSIKTELERAENSNQFPQDFGSEGVESGNEIGIIDSGSASNVSILELNYNADGTVIESVVDEEGNTFTLNLEVTPEFTWKLGNNGVSWNGSKLK